MVTKDPLWLEFQCLNPTATVAELVRIARQNPVWDRELNLQWIEDSFGEAALAGRAVVMYLEPNGTMFYQWARAIGADSLDLLSGHCPTPEQWRNTEGALYVTDICFTPWVRPAAAVRAMMEHLVASGIARSGEKVLFRRTTPGRPERVGWIVA